MTEETRKLSLEIAKMIDNKKGQHIKVLDIHNISNFADYFIIASATSERQVKAIADEIEEKLIEKGIFLDHKEGYNSGVWILLDYIDIVVHLFREEERSFYDIERVWKDAFFLDVDNI